MADKPRVVSACMKRIIRTNGRAHQKPLISGSVTATLGDHATCAAAGDDDGGGDRSDDTFNGRCVAEVRDGHLLIRWDGPSGYCWKLLLRHLNLTPSEHATYGFSLARPECKSPIVSVLVDTETDYHRWTTTIAGQLLSQTPLEDVKYLDILGIVTDRTTLCRRHSSTGSFTASRYNKKANSDGARTAVDNNCAPPLRVYNKKHVSHLPDLIRECERSRESRTVVDQFTDFAHFVPVKQKRLMFEASPMCSSKSVDNLTDLSSRTTRIKSTRSLHNLDLNAVPVKDICRYFENRFNANQVKNSKQFRSLY